MATEIKVPSLGESVVEATVAKWYKNLGDSVAVDEPLVELETDKVTLEVPSPCGGQLKIISANIIIVSKRYLINLIIFIYFNLIKFFNFSFDKILRLISVKFIPD